MMTHTCGKCGFESQSDARFCRQCGSALFVERAETLAATRPHPSAAKPPGQGQWPTSGAPEQPPPQTARFRGYSSHAAAPIYSVPQPQRNSGAFWALIAVVGGVATAGLLSASLLSVRTSRERGSAPESISTKIEDQIRRQAERGARQADEIARVTEQKARSAADSARNAAALAQAPETFIPPTTSTGTRLTTLSLEQLIYPGAVVTNRIGTAGEAMVLKMQTSDDLPKVRSFYSEKLGAPQSSSKKLSVFTQSQGGVNVVVKISRKANTLAQVEISLIQTSLARTSKVSR